MSYTLLYSTITNGALSGTGNALTLGYNIGFSGSPPDAQVFTSLNLANQVPGFPPGTTGTNTECGSSAVLPPLLPGSTVLKAYLICHGRSGFSPNPTILNFGTPSGTVTVPATTDDSTTVYSDVTTIVQNNGGGVYSLSGITLNGPSNTECGWALVLAYQNNSLPKRLLNLYEGSWAGNLIATGFLTPSTGTCNGRIIYSETDMDPGYGVTFTVNGTNITGPNNPGTTGISGLTGNFFAGQINNMDSESPNVGQLDTSGSFGTYNFQGITTSPAVVIRWGTDLTNVSMSNALQNNVYSLTAGVSNGYQAWVAGLQIDTAEPNIVISKQVDKNYAINTDTLNYTIVLDNTTGTGDALGTVVIDTIPSGLAFVPNSLKVDGVTKVGSNPSPPSGVTIGTVPAGSVTTITFQATITNTTLSPYKNSAISRYLFGATPVTVSSNIVTTTMITSAIINPSKSVNVPGGFVGDTLMYTIGFKNTGTTTANNIFFIDTTPNGTTFVTDSIQINGVSVVNGLLNPPNGVTIPNLGINQSATLTFNVVINTIPSPNPTTNIGTANYSYNLGLGLGNQTSTNNTNIVSTYVYPNSNPFKVVDQQYATVGNTLTYTLGWVNTLGVQQTDVVFVDTIPNDTTFVQNSVRVNGITIPGATVTAPNGINIGTLADSQVVNVTFEVVVNTIPSPNPIQNQANVIYSSTLSASRQSNVSNIVDTQINLANIWGVTKSVDKQYATLGDTLTYTVTLANNGNVVAENVVFLDTIPTGTSFINDSLLVNGITIINGNPDYPTGVDIGTLPAQAISTIMFKVVVYTIPSPNSIPNNASLNGDYILNPITNTTVGIAGNSNTVTTKVNFADLSNPIKGVNKNFSDIPTTLTYTITITNTGNTTANNVVFVDTVPLETTFVPNSVIVNGLPITGSNPNPPGVTIGTIPIGQTSTVEFSVLVNTIPTINPIQNTGTVGYNFIVDPSLLTTSTGIYNTNTVNTQINHADLSSISKSVDMKYAQCGDIVTYTILVPNTGNIDALNVILNDTVPNGTTYVANSITVDGNPIGGNPSSINIGTIPARDMSIVIFKVLINC